MSDTPSSQLKSDNNYVLLDPEFELVLPWPLTDPAVFVRHVFRQSIPDQEVINDNEKLRSWINPDDQIIQNLLDGIKRDTEVQKRGREIFSYSDDKAYSDHFNETIFASFARVVGSEEKETQLTEQQVADLTVEHRAEAIRRRYESEVRVDRGAGISILFEGKGNDEVICRQIIGDVTSPAFVIEQVWKRPGGERRILYRNDTSKIETQREGKNATRRSITDIKPALGMAREYFKGTRSGLEITKGVPYDMANDQHRMLCLKCFNKLWLVDTVEALVDSFKNPARD